MKNFGIIKKLSAIILTATLVFCIFNFTVACGNDDENTPSYTFPAESDPIKDGAYFITDAGFAEYKKEHNVYDGLKSSLTVAICNNKLSTTLYKYEYTLSLVNGIYCGKAYGLGEGHYIDVALDGDILYIKRFNTKIDHFQYKLDTSYIITPEYEYKLELPQEYIMEIDIFNSLLVNFKWRPENKFQGIGEFQPAGEDNFTTLRYGAQSIGKMYIMYNDKYLKVGKNIMKFYLKGEPDIDYDNKTVYLVKDSPSLLYEIYVHEDNTITVTEIQ